MELLPNTSQSYFLFDAAEVKPFDSHNFHNIGITAVFR